MNDYIPAQFAREYDTDHGRKLWETLNDRENVARMQTASDLGQPALKPVEDVLLKLFGEQVFADRVKQMIGHMVKQVMESSGYEHVKTDVRMNSVPFYKASLYRKVGETSLYLFRNTKDPREIALTDERSGSKIPATSNGGEWKYVHSITSPIKAQIGYGFDLSVATVAVNNAGYFLHRNERIMRAGRNG